MMSYSEDPMIESKGYRVFEIKPAVGYLDRPYTTKYNAVVLCDSGECTTEINMATLHFSKGSCGLLSHVMVDRPVSMSDDFHAWVLVVSDSFSIDVAMGIPTEMLSALFRNPVKTVTNPDEWEMLLNFMRNIYIYDRLPLVSHSVELAAGIFRCILLMEAEIESQRSTPGDRASYTMADNYLRKFIDLIEKHVKQEHEVIFYAEKLSITPKYLSEICKLKSGHKAKEVISSILATQIKREIVVSGKSMKQLAFEYGFADQSSLGKFFRKATGQSPIAFKRANSAGVKAARVAAHNPPILPTHKTAK